VNILIGVDGSESSEAAINGLSETSSLAIAPQKPHSDNPTHQNLGEYSAEPHGFLLCRLGPAALT
jgi:hypothetical protein